MAERHEIADAIEALAIHCRPPLMSVEDRTRWVADWCEDLKEFPIDAIRTGCNRWRNGTDRKFPLPGQLRALINAADVKGAAAKPKHEPWRPLSDDEYRGLTLREKIRHHQILAHAARREAGPMWRGGKPMASEEMSADWRGHQARAANHDAEAKRLREYLGSQQA